MPLFIFDGYTPFLEAASHAVDADTANHVRRQPAFNTVSNLIAQAGAHDDPAVAAEIIEQAKARSKALEVGWLASQAMIRWAENQLPQNLQSDEVETDPKPKRSRSK